MGNQSQHHSVLYSLHPLLANILLRVLLEIPTPTPPLLRAFVHHQLQVLLHLRQLPLLILPVARLPAALVRTPAYRFQRVGFRRWRFVGREELGVDFVAFRIEVIPQYLQPRRGRERQREFLFLEIDVLAGLGGVRGSQTLCNGSSGLRAADGGVSPDGVDFAEAADGAGEDVDAEADREQAGGDDGVAGCFGFGAEHGIDELFAHLLGG
jgi:hypothetical protein